MTAKSIPASSFFGAGNIAQHTLADGLIAYGKSPDISPISDVSLFLHENGSISSPPANPKIDAVPAEPGTAVPIANMGKASKLRQTRVNFCLRAR